MKNIIRLFIEGVLMVAMLFLAATRGFAGSDNPKTAPLTLADCYRMALKQSETIAIDGELIREAEAHFTQSLGTLLPQVSFAWSQTNQDSEKAFGSFNSNESFESKFVFKQTLFSGFKEFAAIAGSRLERKQYINEKRRAEELLFVDVSDAFYLLLEEQEDLKTLALIRKALKDRIAELKKREDIGKSRYSEVVNTETQLYNIEAEIELARSRHLIARELLSFLIGKKIGMLSDKEDIPDSLGAEAAYAVKAGFRSDVRAADFASGVAEKEAFIAKSALFPTVTLEGDYYEKRNTAPLDANWSTLLKVNVPIFEGTTTYGNIKEADSEFRISRLEYQRAKRLADQDIHDSYVRAHSAIRRFQALKKALRSAELNYSLQKEDYRNNLVGNLDVLTAIQNYGDIRRTYISALYEKKRLYWQLLAATGSTIEEK